jgi:glycosyltransferase involved in cell wall biosynthesis
MPIVSVIVPAYNSAAFIGEAIDSLLTQTLHDIEIIVIDDASNDATYSIAESRARSDTRVRVLRREQSGGAACARNAGLAIASGEYVALLDADDMALPNRLATTIGAMRSTQADIGFADMIRLDMQTGVQEGTGTLAQQEFLLVAGSYLDAVDRGIFRCRPDFLGFMLSHRWVVSVPTIVWSRALLDRESVWFDEALTCAEDMDLFFRLAARGSMVFVNESVAVYRKHPKSLTATAPVVTIVDGVKVRERYLMALRERLRPSDVVAAKRYIAHTLWELGYASWVAGESAEARSQFRRSFRMHRSTAAVIGYLKAFVPRGALVALLRRSVVSRTDTV